MKNKKRNGAFVLLLVFLWVCSVLVSGVIAYEVRDDAAKRRRIDALCIKTIR